MLNKIAIALGLLFGSFLVAWGQSSTLSNLSPTTAIGTTDLFYDVQTPGIGGVKVTGAQFLSFVFGNVSGNCSANAIGQFSCVGGNSTQIAAGTNIATSGTGNNVTVSTILTPTFSTITTTLASITGWLTAAGVNMQTATVAGNLTATTAAFNGFLTATGANLNTATIVSLGGTTQCVESIAGVLTGTGSTCGTGQFSINAGTNIATTGTANNITVSTILTPTFTSVTTTLASVTGWLTTAGANVQTLTIAGSIVTKLRTATTTTASATTDYFLCLDPTAAAVTLTLPGTPLTGLTYLVKDCTGQAATHNIVVTATNANIDGAATFVLSTNYQSIGVTYNGTQWSVN